MDELDQSLIEKEKFFRNQSKEYQKLLEEYKKLIDYKYVLIKTHEILNQNLGIV